jgi:hypothetical protein
MSRFCQRASEVVCPYVLSGKPRFLAQNLHIVGGEQRGQRREDQGGEEKDVFHII